MMNYKIKSRIWVEAEGKVFLGEGRVSLLKAIEVNGSLSKAAKSLDMSYKKAWTLSDAVNKFAKKPVVITSVGGKNGGGAEITPYGKSLIKVFEQIKKGCWEYLDNQTDKIKEL